MTDIGHAGDLGKSQRCDVGTRHGEGACRIGNILLVNFEHSGRDLLGFCHNVLGANVEARASNGHGTGIESAMTSLHLACISLHDIDVLYGNLQHVGGNLGKRCDVAVALTHGARIDRRVSA